MTWLPWRRWQDAEQRAVEAEESLADARAEHLRAKALAVEARELASTNGFAQAIRTAMGV